MLDNLLRGVKDLILLPIAGHLKSVHPNVITIAAFGIGLASVFLLIQQRYAWGLFFWLLNRFLDGLDGTVAQLHQRRSDGGGMLIFWPILPFTRLSPLPWCWSVPLAKYLSLAFLLASFYLNGASWMYLSAILEKLARGAEAKGELTTITMPAGLIGGTETIVFYCLFII